jgi:pyruvate dehydrogenase E1 component
MYEPVDKDTLLYYKEAKDGQILEEGITEAGSMCSFIAAGTAYATHGVNMIPFFIYYSMFGFQRVGDLIWAAADSRAKGFLLGGTAGRTTLSGEGLQHQDGHSHLLAAAVPPVLAYDPAYGYEIAVIIQDGIRRMFQEKEDVFYYLTLYNENYEMAAMPDGSREGILNGMYRFRSLDIKNPKSRVQLFGSGSILREALAAQEILADRYQVASDVWSVTSYKQLRAGALEAERWNRLHPGDDPRTSYLEDTLEGIDGPVIAASDYMKLVPEQIRPWVSGGLVSLGTDGFGRSDTRQDLRRHFEVNAASIALAALSELARRETIDLETVQKALKDLEIDPDKPNPVTA